VSRCALRAVCCRWRCRDDQRLMLTADTTAGCRGNATNESVAPSNSNMTDLSSSVATQRSKHRSGLKFSLLETRQITVIQLVYLICHWHISLMSIISCQCCYRQRSSRALIQSSDGNANDHYALSFSLVQAVQTVCFQSVRSCDALMSVVGETCHKVKVVTYLRFN